MAISLLRSLLFLLPKTLSLFDFKNILALNVPDEGYSRKASYALYMICTLLFICKALVIIVTVYDSNGNAFLQYGACRNRAITL